LVSLAALVAGLASVYAAGETVTIDATAGGGITPYIANQAGTGQDGLTVRVGAFLSANQSTVQALGYNRLWVSNQFSSFGSGTTETLSSQAGSFDPDPNLTNSSDSFKGQQAWWVFSDTASLGVATQYGVVSSTDADWTIPSGNPWVAHPMSADVNIVAFGSITGNSSSDSLRMGAVPTKLYWDSNAAAGLGGSGTWSNANSQLGWTINASGVSASGTYAWGSTSGSNYYAGAGLTANFGGTAGTVTVSGTVDAYNGLEITSNGYTITSGTINLAGSNAAANTINATTGTSTIASTLTGSNGLTKEGSGRLALSGSNSYSGATTVNSGTLEAAAAGALGSTTSVVVNNGGSLLVTASNSVNDAASITLNGGTLAFSGTVGETLGSLTLTANSVIDLGDGGSVWLSLASLASALTSTNRLEFWNYTQGQDAVYFQSPANIQNNLQYISFYSGNGTGTFYNALNTSSFSAPEVYPTIVPEPEAWLAAAALLALALFTTFKQLPQNRPGKLSPKRKPMAVTLSNP